MDDSDEDQAEEIFMDEGTRSALSKIKSTINAANKFKFNFKQLNLQDLGFLKDYQFKQLKQINISKNLLSNIDILIQYQNLRIIDASYNYIESVNLNLQKLEEINLQSNYLTKFPIFQYSYNLKILNLSFNHIENLNGLVSHQIPNLEHLDVGNNRINFENLGEFEIFQEKIQKLNKLMSLILKGNDFLFKRRDDEYSQQFAGINIYISLFTNCKHLYSINEETVEEISQKVIQAQEKEENRVIEKQNSIFQKILNEQYNNSFSMQDKKQKTSVQPSQKQNKNFTQKELEYNSISLSQIVQEIEQANAYSSKALGHLQNLAKKVDLIILNKDKLSDFFVKNMSDNQIIQLIDSFMMNAQMIILNSTELQGIVISILAKLSIFEFINLGAHCFQLLKDVMKSGQDLRTQVATVIQNEIIVLMKEQDPLKIPKTVFLGMIELINDDENNSKILSPKFEQRFYQWFHEYCKVLNIMKSKNLLMPDNENYDALIKLYSIIVYGQWTENEIRENDKYLGCITQIFRQSKEENKRYIPCLRIIQRLSNQYHITANKFVISCLHIDLIDEIQKSISIYKKFNSLFNDSSKESVQEQMYKYQIFSAQITALGSLFNAENRKSFLDHQIIKDTLQILSHQITDPILLTAVCKFALNLFKQSELKDDMEYMTPFLDRICNLTFIMPYLGGEMYFQLLDMTSRYHMSQKQQIVIIQNKKNKQQEDNSQLNVSKISQIKKKKQKEKDQLTEQEQISLSLSSLDDWIVNDLFESIIKLIQFFQEEAQYNDNNPLFKDVQENLNQNDREDHLFSALLIQNKNVQIGVVNCLFAVPLDGFDDGEVVQLVEIVTSCKNISSEQTEIIISTVFWILTKFLSKYEEEAWQEVCINFQQKYAEKIIFSSLDILKRNLERLLDENEEDDEKYTLSLSIINFLKAASGDDCPLMHPHIRNKQNHQVFKQILINEDLYSSKLINEIPIDIENTKISEDLESLINFFYMDTTQSLLPYSDVSVRVIMRIADILMYQNNRQFNQIKGTDQAQNQLFDFHKEIYSQQKILEKGIWIEQQDFIKSIDDDDLDDFIQQHVIFTKQTKVVNNLIEFLVSQVPENEIMLNQISDQMFNLDYHLHLTKNKSTIVHQIKNKTMEAQQKFCKKYQNKNDLYIIRKYMFNKYNKQSDQNQQIIQEEINDEDDPLNKEIYLQQTDENKFYNKMMYEDVGVDYLQSNIITEEQKSSEEQNKEEDINNEDEKQKDQKKANKFNIKDMRNDGFQNKKLRSLSITAFLRCVYASIEFAPIMDLRISAIKNVNNDGMLFKIAQLCDSVDWDENSCLGAKFLRIMRHILLLPFHKNKEDFNKISFYYLIANVIQKLLKKVVYKLKNEIYLTHGDIITNYEISYTFCLILKQTNYFVFSYSDIIDIYRSKELIIKNERRDISVAQNQQNEEEFQQGGAFKEIYDSKSKTYLKKCAQPLQQIDEEGALFIDYKNFQISLPELRQKRSVQEKMVEYLVLSLFSRESVFSLLDILFKDMTYKNRIYDQAMKMWLKDQQKDEDEDLDNNQLIQQQQFQEKYSDKNIEDDNQLKQENEKRVNLKNYISVKEVITIERIKEILSEIMFTCQRKMKYQILEYIVKGVIFEKKNIRESFIQELLIQADLSQYRTTLQYYINQNDLNMQELLFQKSVKDHASSNQGSQQSKRNFERVIFCCKLDTNHVLKKLIGQKIKDNDQPQIEDDTFFKRVFIIGNRGIQIMRDVDKEDICDQCPPYEFCSRGPQPDFSIQFDQIQTIVNFPNIPQKLVIFYMTKEEVKNWNSSYSMQSMNDQQEMFFLVQLTLNVPSYSLSSQIYNTIRQIMIEIESKIEIQGNISYYNIFENQNISENEEDIESINKEPKQLVTQFSAQSDCQLYYDIKLLLSQFDRSFSKKLIKQMKFFMVGIQNTNFVGEDYFKDFIQSKEHLPTNYNMVLVGNLFTKKWQTKAQSKHTEISFLQNGVYMGLTNKYIFFVKEKWSQWKFEQNKSRIERYFRQLKNFENDKFPNALTCKSIQQFNKEMQDYCLKRQTPSLQLLFCIQLDIISQIKVHKSKDPSIQIITNQKDEKKKEDNKRFYTKILFGSDMERQTFVEILWEWHQKNSRFKGEKEDEDAYNMHDESESDDQDATVINYF